MAKSIMIQGTASNAGKSLLVAGLCRVFRQDGYKVAPFKSQNMALNSYITREGLEMGRAQVMQAEAAGIEPLAAMNPILLKPTSDVGSQVIVGGVPQGTMSALDYFAYKSNLKENIMKAYNSLAKENDIIVIEGAGSPAEINLKKDDIVNMGMAKMAKAPVILAGDIDRGGVFASLYGTVKLLDEDEQSIIKGFIINKFRGDVNILKPGFKPLEEMTGKPVMGVVPMLHIDLDDEDSLTERFENKNENALIDIAVIKLPRISNFTDFSPLAMTEDVSVRYITSVKELRRPDLIIIPGTKNTMDDLRWLKTTGLYTAILKHVSVGGALIGICGGYQMMGKEISDPQGVESGGTETGLGVFDSSTIFLGEKTRTRVKGKFNGVDGIFESMRNIKFEGYEIHMGLTETNGRGAVTIWESDEEKKPDGMFGGNVFGCYIHGLFDKGECSSAIINCLRVSKGLDKMDTAINWYEYKQKQYDKLADAIRSSLDIEKVYKILDEGI